MVSDDSLLDRFPFSVEITVSLSLAFGRPVIGLRAKLHNTLYLCVLLHYDLSSN